MEFSILSKIGLNKNDIRIYETLLKLGRSKTGAIMKLAGVSSSSTYASLTSLLAHGLVSYQVKNNVKYYQAEMPDQVIEDTKNQTRALETLMKNIVSLPIEHTERNEFNIYQGARGFTRAYEMMADEVQAGEEVKVITYSTYYGKSKHVRTFFAELDKKLFQKKAKIRILVDTDLKKIIISDRSSFIQKYEFRCLPKEYFTPCGLNISNTMVVMNVWGKNPITFVMRNPAIVESFKVNFNFLWSKGKK